MNEALAGKVIVVVGGTSGLGLAAAKAILQAGAAGVVVTGRSAERGQSALAQLGGQAESLLGDAANPRHAEAAIDAARKKWGHCDALYHVAGGSGRSWGDGPLHELTDEAVPRTLELNLQSVIYSNRAMVRHFLQTGTRGPVLNLGSVLGWSPSPRFFSTHVYAAAKSGIIGFTKACAACYAARGIRFNVIAPALVDTPMARRAAGNELIQAFIHHKQPLDGGRIGCPEDLDAAVVYLLSDGAKFTTGQVLAVDGGWGVSEGHA